MGALSSAKPRPRTEAPQAAEVETPTAQQPVVDDPNHISGYTSDDFARFMAETPEMPPLPGDNAPAGEPAPQTTAEGTVPPVADAGADAGGADTASSRKWYKRWFGAKDADGPEQMEANAELDDEMYAVTAEAATEVTDQVLPMFIGKLHDEPAENFKADEDQKRGLARAWELYQRSKQMRLSPLQFLIFKITIVYGVNFLMGVFKWVGRLQVYGWHMPWSDSWKTKAMGNSLRPDLRPPTEAPTDFAQAQPQNAAVAQPAPMPQTPPPPPVPPKPTPAAPPKTTSVPNLKSCVETSKVFRVGLGYPQPKHKTAERFPELVDKFIDKAAFMAYSNKHGLYGQGGKKGMNHKAEATEQTA